MICPRCTSAADRRAPADQHCTDPKCMCGHRVERYRPRLVGIRGLLEHVGIDTTGRNVTIAGRVIDPSAGPLPPRFKLRGEHGPELVQLPDDATVHPLTTTKD